MAAITELTQQSAQLKADSKEEATTVATHSAVLTTVMVAALLLGLAITAVAQYIYSWLELIKMVERL